MNKQEIYEYLSQQHIWYEVTEHKAVYIIRCVNSLSTGRCQESFCT